MNPTRRRIILLNINLLTLTHHPKPRLPPFFSNQTSIIRSLIRILNRLVLPHTLPAYREKVLVRVKCLLRPNLSKTDDGQTSQFYGQDDVALVVTGDFVLHRHAGDGHGHFWRFLLVDNIANLQRAFFSVSV